MRLPGYKQPLRSHSSFLQRVYCLDVAALMVFFPWPLALACWEAEPLIISSSIIREHGRDCTVDGAS